MKNIECEEFKFNDFFIFTHIVLLAFRLISLIVHCCVSTLQVCVWQELQAVRTEISCLEEQKRNIGDTVRALVVSIQ